MKIHQSAEDYLETILVLTKKKGSVRSIDIVNELDYARPSVSIAMKRLREKGYIEMDSGGHITLTEQGRAVAESVYERHRVLAAWLMAIGVEEKVALDDACRIEHVISRQSFEKIKQFAEQATKPET